MDPLTLGATIQAGLKLIDKFVADPKQKEEAKLEFLKEQNQHALLLSQQETDQYKISLSAINSEAQSNDPFTSRARPTFLYVMYLLILMCMFGSIVGIWWPVEVSIAADNLRKLLMAIPEELWWLFGTGYLGYGIQRSFDKYQQGKLKRLGIQ